MVLAVYIGFVFTFFTWVTNLEVHLCMMSGQLILSGKPFNTFSMARLKILQLRLTLTPLFTTTKDPTNHDSRRLKFAIFESFTNNGELIRVRNEGSRE
jgi:hypothetical protein